MPQHDPNNYSWVLDKLWAVLFLLFGWMWSRIGKNERSAQDAKDSLSNHKLHLAENYMPKSDFRDFKEEMASRFDRIETLIRGKE